MKTYKIKLNSVVVDSEELQFYCSTNLEIGTLYKMFKDLTPYNLTILEVDNDYSSGAKNLEEMCNRLLEARITKTTAKNAMVKEKLLLGIFPERPNIELKVWEKKWHGMSTGTYRTYIKNMSAKRWNIMFPQVECFHCEENKIWCDGILTLEREDDNLFYLEIEREVFKVTYETVTLER